MAYHLLYLYESLFIAIGIICICRILFLDYLKNPIPIILKFFQYLWPYLESCTSPIQPDHSTMTSFRRHFVISPYHEYLHNHGS